MQHFLYMPRGPRLAFENSFLHVFNRGINKQPIFLEHRDYQYFMQKVRALKSKYDHSIYALCLMPNHFHISVQTRKIPISKIMSSLATSYSMYFNKKYHHFGPIFQNRFKSILIENSEYFLQLSRYIYINPVKASLAADPLHYPYSTFKEIVSRDPQEILDADISMLIGEKESQREAYIQSVYESIGKDMSDYNQLFEKEESILGSNIFGTRAKKKYLRRKARISG